MQHKKCSMQKVEGVVGLTKKTIMLWPGQLPMLDIVNKMPVRKPIGKRFCILP